MLEALVSRRWVVPGGHDLLGRELRLLDRAALAAAVADLAAASPRCVAVVAAGSAGQPVHERTVADAVQAALPGARISAAHDFGGHGSAAREATVIADAALRGAVDAVVDRAEAVLRRRAGGRGAELRLCRGDGGSLSAERARAAPVLVLGSGQGPAVLGAAQLAVADGCRVLLPAADGGHLVGGVRNGLALVRPLVVGEPAAELVVPSVALDRARPSSPAADRPDRPDRTGRAGAPGAQARVPDVVADGELDELACVGAALARPLSWLDEIAAIGSADDLAAVQRAAVRRATAVATANGAEPGSADVVEVSTVAVPYSRAGTVRVRVRVGGVGR
nr:hydantoinase/oxoprolinase N-terminal domain-containing protein [Quadrisphaera sp. RL12-1S]